MNLQYPKIDPVQPLPENFTDRKTLYQQIYSSYFQDLMEFSETIKFLLGGRYDSWLRESRTEKLFDLNDNYVSKSGSPSDRTRSDAKVFTYRVGLIYQPLHYYTA